MTRLVRILGVAVLIALSLGAHASARLDPGRVFNPGSGSFLSALAFAPHSFSLVGASIFNERVDSDDLFLPAPQLAGFGSPGSLGVNLSLPQIRATFEPSRAGELSFVPATLSAVPPQSVQPVAAQTVEIHTAAPEAPAPQDQTAHFGSYAPYTPALSGSGEGATLPVRLGKVNFNTAFATMQKCGTADSTSPCAQGLSGGAAFSVRAGSREVNLSLESGVTHFTNQTPGVFAYVPLDADAQAGLTYPGVSDVFGQNVGAKVAVPVTQHLTVGLQFDRAHYEGDSATNILPGFQGQRDTYLGNLTYQIKGSSAITFSARQYRYQDLLTPGLKATQTRADLNFTVKF